MKLNPLELVSRLNSSYWFVPTLVTLGGVALAVLLLFLETHWSLPENQIVASLRPSSPEGARALLAALIGAMITAISVTFSVTVVALTVAAQHFGARVLNSFVRHTSAQVVLGTFMATFAYSVLVLGAIDDTGEKADAPGLAVAGAVALVVVSIGALIFYVHHVSTSLQIGEIAHEIAADMKDAVERLHAGDERAADDGATTIDEPPAQTASVSAPESGYMQRVDFDSIVDAAARRGAVVWIRREPGAFVLAATPLAVVHPPEACDEAMADVIRQACVVGKDRTLWHDAEFAVKQLVEIALRALSPGVNEPFTAMTCIDRLAEGLGCVAAAPPPRARWNDREGNARVYVRAQPFTTLLRASFDPIRIFAGSNPAIYARLLQSIGELSLVVTRESDRSDLKHQAEVVRRALEATLEDADDRRYVMSIHEETVAQLEHRRLALRD